MCLNQCVGFTDHALFYVAFLSATFYQTALIGILIQFYHVMWVLKKLLDIFGLVLGRERLSSPV